jgi:Concanavalin A-like lectin/glucanases superfamily
LRSTQSDDRHPESEEARTADSNEGVHGRACRRWSRSERNGSAEVGVSGTGKLPTGRWLNLVTTIDGSSITYYIDGARVGGQRAVIDIATTMYSATNTTSGFLGKPFWSGHPFLAGALDDARVYDSALSASDVAALAGSSLATLTGASRTRFDATASSTCGRGSDSSRGGRSPGGPGAVPACWT